MSLDTETVSFEVHAGNEGFGTSLPVAVGQGSAISEPSFQMAATILNPDQHVTIRDIDRAGFGLKLSGGKPDFVMGSNQIPVTPKR